MPTQKFGFSFNISKNISSAKKMHWAYIEHTTESYSNQIILTHNNVWAAGHFLYVF